MYIDEKKKKIALSLLCLGSTIILEGSDTHRDILEDQKNKKTCYPD